MALWRERLFSYGGFEARRAGIAGEPIASALLARRVSAT